MAEFNDIITEQMKRLAWICGLTPPEGADICVLALHKMLTAVEILPLCPRTSLCAGDVSQATYLYPRNCAEDLSLQCQPSSTIRYSITTSLFEYVNNKGMILQKWMHYHNSFSSQPLEKDDYVIANVDAELNADFADKCNHLSVSSETFRTATTVFSSK
ncbi:hypothetical protein RB195_022278 [Necator americanus]|uniref:Uncharacterized protein n=1 Tax=Necator americanus TaxID=51031 RepID=A0ABR1EEN6_NECAM